MQRSPRSALASQHMSGRQQPRALSAAASPPPALPAAPHVAASGARYHNGGQRRTRGVGPGAFALQRVRVAGERRARGAALVAVGLRRRVGEAHVVAARVAGLRAHARTALTLCTLPAVAYLRCVDTAALRALRSSTARGERPRAPQLQRHCAHERDLVGQTRPHPNPLVATPGAYQRAGALRRQGGLRRSAARPGPCRWRRRSVRAGGRAAARATPRLRPQHARWRQLAGMRPCSHHRTSAEPPASAGLQTAGASPSLETPCPPATPHQRSSCAAVTVRPALAKLWSEQHLWD